MPTGGSAAAAVLAIRWTHARQTVRLIERHASNQGYGVKVSVGGVGLGVSVKIRVSVSVRVRVRISVKEAPPWPAARFPSAAIGGKGDPPEAMPASPPIDSACSKRQSG